MLEQGKVVFDNWTVEGVIGAGAFGTVYKIKKEELGQVSYSALKVLKIPQDVEENKRLRSEGMDEASISNYYSQIAQNFLKEIELLASLDGNANVVAYEDHMVEPNDNLGFTVYIKMQLLNPIANVLVNPDGSARFMSYEEVIKLGKDMCSALELCESKRIIHRDIKIDNIFVSDIGDYKLGDFGIAKQLEATQGEMSKKGTVLYMAPEVFRGQNYDKTVDIYSLGVVLYRLLNKNRAPFFPNYPNPIRFSDKEEANAKRLRGDVFPDIVGISAELNAVLKKACAFNPVDRYQSASEFKAALESVAVMPFTPMVAEPAIVNIIEDEKTESAYAPSTAAYMNEATVGVYDSTPIAPAAPVAPAIPVAPAAPAAPVMPVAPAVPVAAPVMPVAPVAPATPVMPVAPAVPVAAPQVSNTPASDFSVDDSTVGVFDSVAVAPVNSPVVNAPCADASVDEATVGVFGATPVAPVVPVNPVAPAKPAATAAPIAPVLPAVANIAPSTDNKSNKSKVVVIIIAAVLALVVGVCAAIFLLGGKGDSENDGTTENTTTTESVGVTGDDGDSSNLGNAKPDKPGAETTDASVSTPTQAPTQAPTQTPTQAPSNNDENRIYYWELIYEDYDDVLYIEDYCYVNIEYVYVYDCYSEYIYEIYSDDWKTDEDGDSYVVPGDTLDIVICRDPDYYIYRVYEVYDDYGNYVGLYDEDEMSEAFDVTYSELLGYGPYETLYVYDYDGYWYEAELIAYYSYTNECFYYFGEDIYY